MRIPILLAMPMVLVACEPTPSTTVELPLFGDGYRAEGDQCRRVGENAYTNQYLDDSSDLVACPADYEGLGVFLTETGATEVDRVGDYILYTVSRG